jgi:hypothetical protein
VLRVVPEPQPLPLEALALDHTTGLEPATLGERMAALAPAGR